MPSCNGARVGLACSIALLFALQNFAAVPCKFSLVVCTCIMKIQLADTLTLPFASWVWWHLDVG